MAHNISNSSRCDVAMLVDAETVAQTRHGAYIPERNSVEAHVLRALRARHARVEVVPFDIGVAATVERLQALRPRLVFNLTEWLDGDRSLDAAIAGLLDLLGIPYTGTGPDGMRLARDKALSKAVVSRLGVAVPRHFLIDHAGRIRNPGLPYPLIVKPQFGDASEEIGAKSVVASDAALRRQVRAMRRRGGGALICEEFIPGSDLYVPLLGNSPEVLRPIELVIGSSAAAAPRTATYRLKNDVAYRRKWQIRWRSARLDEAMQQSVARASRAIFRALKLRDYARIDFRLTPDRRLVFLEANPNPDLHPHTMGRNLCFNGVGYGELVRRIVEAARRRR
jgi:D-alanine-D-alanine ligase